MPAEVAANFADGWTRKFQTQASLLMKVRSGLGKFKGAEKSDESIQKLGEQLVGGDQSMIFDAVQDARRLGERFVVSYPVSAISPPATTPDQS